MGILSIGQSKPADGEGRGEVGGLAQIKDRLELRSIHSLGTDILGLHQPQPSPVSDCLVCGVQLTTPDPRMGWRRGG